MWDGTLQGKLASILVPCVLGSGLLLLCLSLSLFIFLLLWHVRFIFILGCDHLSRKMYRKWQIQKCHFLKKINLFIDLLLAALGLRCCAWAFPSCGEQRSLFVAVRGLPIAVASRCGAQAPGTWASVVVACGLSSCGSQALEHSLSSCGARALVAPRHVGSSQTGARTRVPCTGRQTPNHWATRRSPEMPL